MESMLVLSVIILAGFVFCLIYASMGRYVFPN